MPVLKRLLFFFYLSIYTYGFCQTNWNIAPMTCRLDAAPGDTVMQTIIVTNNDNKDRDFLVYAKDWRYTIDGEDVETEDSNESRGLLNWISFAPSQFTVPAGGSEAVRLQVNVPDTSDAGFFWGGIYIAPDEPPVLASRIGRTEGAYEIYVRIRAKANILVTVQGVLEYSGQVNWVEAEPDSAGSGIIVKTRFENTGNMLLRCTGTVDIRDANDETVDSFEMDNFNVLPGYEREVVSRREMELAPGTYSALVVVDFKGDYLVAGEAFFEIPGR